MPINKENFKPYKYITGAHMNIQTFTPYKNIIIPFFAFVLFIIFLTNMTFANSDEKNTNVTQENTKQEDTTQKNTSKTDNSDEYKNPSFNEITNNPHYQTQIYGGSSTIISGDTITTSNSHPQGQINNTQINNNPNNQPNQEINNNNSNKDGFYFNVTGSNGSSMSMGAFFGNSSNNSPVRKSTSQIINGSEIQTKSFGSPQQGSRIINE